MIVSYNGIADVEPHDPKRSRDPLRHVSPPFWLFTFSVSCGASRVAFTTGSVCFMTAYRAFGAKPQWFLTTAQVEMTAWFLLLLSATGVA
jgi:hypothetical protein